MSYVFSPEKNAFYPLSLKATYVNAGTWPEDATQVEDSVYIEFAAPPPEGKFRQAGPDGLPVWEEVKAVEQSEEQIKARARALRDSFILSTDKLFVDDYTIDNVGLSEVAKLTSGEGALAMNGWVTLPISNERNLIIQWGRVSVDYAGKHSPYTTVGGEVNRYTGGVNFPIIFPNALLCVNSTGNDVVNTYIASIYQNSTARFDWSYHSTAAYQVNSGGGNSFSWFAIGY
ncbi:gp53-like domain-containing protein [Citrobacter braakii]|uniref:gp53-like domain-containing protein n=1 Tax=Citrobacter braakii TaxID=57706 RepID=UPI002B24A634|nr:tail fiber assembly protein [Citrobacter braakii]MEB2439863.1 tail fiber assembly protein [Citrobacter braakii]